MPEALGVDVNQYYTQEFYQYCFNALNENGYLATQASNPNLNQGSFLTIKNTIENSGFISTSYQAQIPTIGQWSWVIGSKDSVQINLKNLAVNTKWIDEEAMQMMFSFGKMGYYPGIGDSVNTIKKPLLVQNRSTRL